MADELSGSLYVVFWIFAVLALQPRWPRGRVAAGVLCATIALEFAQLWRPPWLERIRHFPADVIDETLRSLPPAWLEDDEADLHRLMDRLMRRRGRVAVLIEAIRDADFRPFPKWR